MIIPDLVVRNFSRRPSYYDANAEIQKKAAAELAALISAFPETQQPRRVLEIGCGTGFLTKPLFRSFPTAEFVVSDISPAMLAFCERSTSDSAKRLAIQPEFILLDASSDSLPGKFDLTASSLAFQWVEDFRNLAHRIRMSLNDGGILAFATLADGTFASVKRLFQSEGVDFPMPEFPHPSALRDALRGFTVRDFRVDTMTEEFRSPRTFLRHLQGVGAVNATGKPVPPAKLARIIRGHSNEPISAEYKVVFILATAD